MKSRIRLPEGFVRFRRDLGRVLRRRRRGVNILQKDLAESVGITRESLSRIERGRGWPSYDTVYTIMGLLDLEWHHIAIAGQARRPSRRFPEKWRDEHRVDLGSALRAGRELEGLTLRDLAEACGISYSQLSRIERGDSFYSRVLEEHPDDGKLDYDYRRLRFNDPMLAALAAKGRPMI